LEVKLGEAQGIKKEYASLTLTASQLGKRYDSGEISWCAPDITKMQALVAALQAGLTAFGSVYVTTEMKTIRKDFKDRGQVLQSEVTQFVDHVKKPLADLGKQILLIKTVIAARNSVQ